MLIKEENLIFDFDGTLFDSAPEILKCLKKVFYLNKLKNKKDFNESLIGPPIKEMLKKLVQKKDLDMVDKIIKDFINLYDSEYCFKTKLYDGVKETLKILAEEKKLILITNKRISPTEKMLKNSGIIDFFDNYYSVDPNDISKKDKSILIENTIKDLDINPDSSVYIGDTEGDFIASNTNGIKFIYAGWGYGEFVEQAHLHLTDIRELI
tara:strand:- start:5445 stop:6071 length:627 start_codon:yes stop_codon:yes gene_type:complete